MGKRHKVILLKFKSSVTISLQNPCMNISTAVTIAQKRSHLVINSGKNTNIKCSTSTVEYQIKQKYTSPSNFISELGTNLDLLIFYEKID